jgi:hypothetical protein
MFFPGIIGPSPDVIRPTMFLHYIIDEMDTRLANYFFWIAKKARPTLSRFLPCFSVSCAEERERPTAKRRSLITARTVHGCYSCILHIFSLSYPRIVGMSENSPSDSVFTAEGGGTRRPLQNCDHREAKIPTAVTTSLRCQLPSFALRNP